MEPQEIALQLEPQNREVNDDNAAPESRPHCHRRHGRFYHNDRLDLTWCIETTCRLGTPAHFSRQLPELVHYDGHTLGTVIDDTEKLTDCAIEQGYVDKGYRGHDTKNPRRIIISGQKRGVFGVIKRELRPRSAIEAVIGHLKADNHLGRCYLKGRGGDAANVVLPAIDHNFRLVLAWLRILLRLILNALSQAFPVAPAFRWAS